MNGWKKPLKRKVENRKNNNNYVDSFAVTDKNIYQAYARNIDRNYRKALAAATGPIDYPAFLKAVYDRFVHLCFSPGAFLKLLLEGADLAASLCASCPESSFRNGRDIRFLDPLWNKYPYSVYRDTYIETEKYLKNQTRNIRGVEPHSEQILDFLTGQLTECFNPYNFLFSNPVILKTTLEENGGNLLRGWLNFIDNLIRHNGEIMVRHSKEDYHVVGKTLATTPGKVIFRNELVEVIQYSPETGETYAVPVLLVPAWINKYYILDLKPENSMVRYLVSEGFSVFMVSWKNVDSSYRDYGLAEYMEKGTISAIKAVTKQTGSPSVTLAGYCMGAITTAVAAAYLKAKGDNSVKNLTLFAGQLDFSDSGDLKSFIDESQISFLEDLMEEKGYLDKKNMSQTFSLLKPKDLFWNYVIDEFVLGKDPFNLDFLFWNDDGTRMPKKMHMEILRDFYLNDVLTEGKFRIDGKSIDLRDIDMDLYSVGTMKDHIAPWQSVYRIPHFVSSPIKFVLASKGHIAGIINPPKTRDSYYNIDGILGKGPIHWLETSTRKDGSWWDDWVRWLKKRSGNRVAAYTCPSGADALCDAPGTYVFEK